MSAGFYVFAEFPKWVTPSDGSPPRVVQDADEEAALMASKPSEPDKTSLRATAASLGIEVDGRWNVDRLKTEIAAAQAAPPSDMEPVS